MELTEAEVRLVARARYYRKKKPHWFYLGWIAAFVVVVGVGIALHWWVATFVVVILIGMLSIGYFIRFMVGQRREENRLVEDWRVEERETKVGVLTRDRKDDMV